MRNINPLGVLGLILVPGLLTHLACGGSKSSPTGPTSVVATPTAAPTAAPTATPALSACDRLERVGEKSACNVTSGSLTTEVSDAIDRVIATRQALFEMSATNDRGDPHVIDQPGYYQAVIAELDAAAICAARVEGSDLDIHVTNEYSFSDRFQIMSGNGYPRRGKGSYVESCVPAALPKVSIDHVDRVFVTAYGTLNCEPGVTNPFVNGARPEIPVQCEVSITATPKTWGGLDVPKGVHGDEIEWNQVEGDAIFWEWETERLNITLSPRSVGPLKICATIVGVTGCLDGVIVP